MKDGIGAAMVVVEIGLRTDLIAQQFPCASREDYECIVAPEDTLYGPGLLMSKCFVAKLLPEQPFCQLQVVGVSCWKGRQTVLLGILSFDLD